jgi:hypothetical protein
MKVLLDRVGDDALFRTSFEVVDVARTIRRLTAG